MPPDVTGERGPAPFNPVFWHPRISTSPRIPSCALWARRWRRRRGSLSLALSLSVQPFKYQPVQLVRGTDTKTPRLDRINFSAFSRGALHRDVEPPGEPSAGGALSEGAHRHRAEPTGSDPNPAIPDRHTRAPAGGSSGWESAAAGLQQPSPAPSPLSSASATPDLQPAPNQQSRDTLGPNPAAAASFPTGHAARSYGTHQCQSGLCWWRW